MLALYSELEYLVGPVDRARGNRAARIAQAVVFVDFAAVGAQPGQPRRARQGVGQRIRRGAIVAEERVTTVANVAFEEVGARAVVLARARLALVDVGLGFSYQLGQLRKTHSLFLLFAFDSLRVEIEKMVHRFPRLSSCHNSEPDRVGVDFPLVGDDVVERVAGEEERDS